MRKEAEKAMIQLEKVFGRLTDAIEKEEADDFKACGYLGLDKLLTLTDKTFALMERIATKLRKCSWE